MRVTGGVSGRIDRWMMRRLRAKGWIVFWLDKPARHCKAVCWLEQYEQEMAPRPHPATAGEMPTPTIQHWQSEGVKLTKRYVRHSGRGWEESDDIGGPWTPAQ